MEPLNITSEKTKRKKSNIAKSDERKKKEIKPLSKCNPIKKPITSAALTEAIRRAMGTVRNPKSNWAIHTVTNVRINNDIKVKI